VACLPVPRAFPSLLLYFDWWPPLLFLVRIFFQFNVGPLRTVDTRHRPKSSGSAAC
jgi:hypothetical protein